MQCFSGYFMTKFHRFTCIQKHSIVYVCHVLILPNLKSVTLLSIPRYGDFTTQSGVGEGLYFKNGSLQDEKLKILSRTYAQVIPNYIPICRCTNLKREASQLCVFVERLCIHLSYLFSITACLFQSVPGRYVNMTFDPSTSKFTVTFKVDTNLGVSDGSIYLNEKLYYPNGFSVR